MSLVDFDDLHLSRNAFSPRDVARAGDLWRLLQDAAVLGSARLGWHPARYRAEGCAFVVRRMTVRHGREVQFGEDLGVRTWVSSFRGGRFSNRQVRVNAGEQTVCAATQEWLHVSSPELRITRASPDLLAAFGLHDLGPDVEMPDMVEAVQGPENRLVFRAWHTWMDPLAHANHPLYVDWLDEALARVMAGAGLDPHGAISRAETVAWRSGAEAMDEVEVRTRLIGLTDAGEAVVDVVFVSGERELATATAVRSHVDGAEALVRALS